MEEEVNAGLSDPLTLRLKQDPELKVAYDKLVLLVKDQAQAKQQLLKQQIDHGLLHFSYNFKVLI